MKPSLVQFVLLCLGVWMGGCAATVNLTGEDQTEIFEEEFLPSVIEFEGGLYTVDDVSDQALYTVGRGDLDADGSSEFVLGVQGRSKDGLKYPLAFLIVGHDRDGEFEISHVESAGNYFRRLELRDLTDDGIAEVVFWSNSGAHQTNLDVYQYSKGQLQRIFRNGSYCDIRIENKPALISLGRQRWEHPDWNYACADPFWEVWYWDGGAFVYNKTISTSAIKPQDYLDGRKKTVP